jgi:amino acid permease
MLASSCVKLQPQAAIITSFIGFVLGLLDFFTDVFNIKEGDTQVRCCIYVNCQLAEK